MEDFNTQALETQVRKALADPSPFIQMGRGVGPPAEEGCQEVLRYRFAGGHLR